jgi:1-acyl-sn-glycerol-3-phosphate acyltransferase
MFGKLKALSEINDQLSNYLSPQDCSNKLVLFFHSNKNIRYYNFNELDNIKKGFIIITNHTCIASDIILILSKINCFTVSVKELFNTLLYFSKLTNEQLAERCQLIEYHRKTENTESNGEKVKQSILEKINKGEIVQIYPEGGMSGKKKLNQFKKGFLHLAFENNIPILPMIIDYKDDYYSNTESEPDRLVHHLEDTSGIDIHVLKFIYPEDFDTFDKFYDNVYNTMNDFYIECKK